MEEIVPWTEIAEVELFLQEGSLGSFQDFFMTLHGITDIDRIWAARSDLFLSAVDKCIPKLTAKRNSNAPWISRDLIKLCTRKKALFNSAKKPV